MYTFSFNIGRQKYDYILKELPPSEDGKIVNITCQKLNVDQKLLAEDVPEFILDLPQLALDIKAHEKNNTTMKFRIPATEKQKIEKKAAARGYKNTSDFLRDLAISA